MRFLKTISVFLIMGIGTPALTSDLKEDLDKKSRAPYMAAEDPQYWIQLGGISATYGIGAYFYGMNIESILLSTGMVASFGGLILQQIKGGIIFSDQCQNSPR